MSNGCTRPRACAWALAAVVAMVVFATGSTRALAQCEGNFTGSGLGACSPLCLTPSWDNGNCTAICVTNGSSSGALCCMLDAGAFRGMLFGSELIAPGQTRKFNTPCGCLTITVGTPVLNTVAITVSMAPGAC